MSPRARRSARIMVLAAVARAPMRRNVRGGPEGPASRRLSKPSAGRAVAVRVAAVVAGQAGAVKGRFTQNHQKAELACKQTTEISKTPVANSRGVFNVI
jgi:hypothetical protein